MNNVVFVTNHLGPKVLWDLKGKIGTFKNTNNNVTTADDGVLRRDMKIPGIWCMVLTDPDRIQRMKDYPTFGKDFNITSKEPVWNTVNNLRTLKDPNAASAINADQIKADIMADQQKKQEDFEEKQKQDAVDMRRYGNLWSEVCKAGGAFLADADPVLVTEFKELQEKLGINEEVTAESV